MSHVFSMHSSQYWRNIASKVVVTGAKEDIVYAVLAEFLQRHGPVGRFVIYPQMSLRWKPENRRDRRLEIPDFGVGNFTPVGEEPPFKLRFGVEAKRAMPEMSALPPPLAILHDKDVLRAFHSLHYQAEDQAKAAIKNRYHLLPKTVNWVLIIGPYWTPVTFGPFSEAELTVRAHKKASSSTDWKAQSKMEGQRDGKVRQLTELYLLYESASVARLHQLLEQTDQAAQPLINSLQRFTTEHDSDH